MERKTSRYVTTTSAKFRMMSLFCDWHWHSTMHSSKGFKVLCRKLTGGFIRTTPVGNNKMHPFKNYFLFNKRIVDARCNNEGPWNEAMLESSRCWEQVPLCRLPVYLLLYRYYLVTYILVPWIERAIKHVVIYTDCDYCRCMHTS